MTEELQRAQAYQIMALNNEMLKKGHISRNEHDFIQRLQAEKLTKLNTHATLRAQETYLH